MSIAYQNVDFYNYSAEPPENIIGQEYTFQFSTIEGLIKAINPQEYELMYYLSALTNGRVDGFSIVDMGSNKVFGNLSDIILPTEIGESVTGTLADITDQLYQEGRQ